MGSWNRERLLPRRRPSAVVEGPQALWARTLRATGTRILHPSSRGLLLALLVAVGAVRIHAQESEPALPDLLSRLDRASRLYLDSVLRFSCDETITETGLSQAIHRFNYLFIYDEKKGFVDYRTLSGRLKAKPVDPAGLGHRYLQRSYLWVLVFHKTRQPLHRYRLEGREIFSGKDSWKVSFEPQKPFKEDLNDWFGTAWVDARTFQVLHVEAMRVDDHAAFVQMQQDRLDAARGRPIPVSRWVVPVESVTTDFSVEKNGMFFPGETDIVLTKYTVPFDRAVMKKDTEVLNRTVQKYSHYRFFGVRDASEIRKVLSETEPVASSP
jgi:hypothetical protein